VAIAYLAVEIRLPDGANFDIAELNTAAGVRHPVQWFTAVFSICYYVTFKFNATMYYSRQPESD